MENLDARNWSPARRVEVALPDGTAPARLTPRRYEAQFTASEQQVLLVEQAHDGTRSHPYPSRKRVLSPP